MDRLYFIELDGLHITAWFDEAREGQVIAEVLRVRLDEQVVVVKTSAEEAR